MILVFVNGMLNRFVGRRCILPSILILPTGVYTAVLTDTHGFELLILCVVC